MKTLMTAAAMSLAALSPALAGDRDVVDAFYGQVLNGTRAADLTDRVGKVLAPDWASIGDYQSPAKTREQFTQQLQYFGKLIPNLTWKVEEVIESGNRFIVRGRASGTPAADFFGVPPTGKSFEIMSIDIHTVEGGKIARSYHVEDWAGALKQLKAQ